MNGVVLVIIVLYDYKVLIIYCILVHATYSLIKRKQITIDSITRKTI